jgi:hypothetical protein
VNRRQRALTAAVAIIPVTVAGISLLHCGCALAGWTIEIATAIAYFVWLTAKR